MSNQYNRCGWCIGRPKPTCRGFLLFQVSDFFGAELASLQKIPESDFQVQEINMWLWLIMLVLRCKINYKILFTYFYYYPYYLGVGFSFLGSLCIKSSFHSRPASQVHSRFLCLYLFHLFINSFILFLSHILFFPSWTSTTIYVIPIT